MADVILIIGLFLFFIVLPSVIVLREIYLRRKFPIRAKISYEEGGSGTKKKTTLMQDRLGYVDVRSAKDEKTGSKEWRLQKIQRNVQNFRLDYICEEVVWFGLKTAKVAYICAVMGPKGEEFYPIRYNASTKDFTPVFDGDRGLMLWKIGQDIENRNKYENWIKQNILQLVQSGLMLMIIVMLFLVFMKIGDIATVLGNSLDRNNACVAAIDEKLNTTSTPLGITTGNIGGVPFMAVPSGG